jgi:hypothetical protein
VVGLKVLQIKILIVEILDWGELSSLVLEETPSSVLLVSHLADGDI